MCNGSPLLEAEREEKSIRLFEIEHTCSIRGNIYLLLFLVGFTWALLFFSNVLWENLFP